MKMLTALSLLKFLFFVMNECIFCICLYDGSSQVMDEKEKITYFSCAGYIQLFVLFGVLWSVLRDQ